MHVNRRAFVGGATAIAAASGAARAATRKSGGGRAEAKALSAIASYMDQHRADWGIPGMTLCVVSRSGFEGYAMSGLAHVEKNVRVGPDHLFQIGSITKMMTGLTAWSLIDEGKLSPDARLRDVMPEIAVRGGEDITLRHLLDHTAGLPRGASPYVDGGLWVGTRPGAHWAYSNLGYRLAGKIIERTDRRLYPDSVEARVLRPLGMMQSLGAMRAQDRDRYAQGYEPALLDRPAMRPAPMAPAPWVDFDASSGCVASTASDMALFLRFLLDLADGKGGSVFSDENAARFMADPAPAPGWSEGARYGYGVAHIEQDGRAYLHHTGGMVSFSSSLHVDAAAGVAAFASGNVHYARNYRPRDVTMFACQALHAGQSGAPAPAPKPTKPVVENPQRFAGVFTAQSGDSFEIVAGDNSVAMRREGRDIKMQPVGAGHFACDDEAFALTGLQFELEDDTVMRAWAGGVEYLPASKTDYLATAPALKALEGRYGNDSRWSTPIRVFARGDRLVMKNANYVTVLAPMENGDWRLGEAQEGADRARFDSVVDGKPQRLLMSGTPFFRRFS